MVKSTVRSIVEQTMIGSNMCNLDSTVLVRLFPLTKKSNFDTSVGQKLEAREAKPEKNAFF